MSTNAKFAFTLICFLVLSVVGMGVYADRLERSRDDYKLQVNTEHDKVLETQLKYEEMRGERDNLQRDLADRDERLAQAAERERAAKVRASRSRQVRASADVQRKRISGLGYPSGLRDITKYCPTGNTTASGKWPRVGMVATLSRSIPFGTRVVIEGLGEFVVEDRIGHGSEFDIFTNSCAEADRFGRQHRRVTVLA